METRDKVVIEAILHILKFNDSVKSALYAHLNSASGRRLTEHESAFFGDGFATTHHVDFLHDQKFRETYLSAWDDVSASLLWERDNFNIAWRAHICTWAAKRAMDLEGDFVECGVWYGLLSLMVCKWVDFSKSNKRFWLFDTWGEMEGSHENENYKTDIFETVKARFSNYTNVKLIRGVVPRSLNALDSVEKVAYVSIDMNGHIAERAALEIIYPKVTKGGIIYFDDYGWNYPKLRETISDFLRDKPEELLHFPSGNSVLIKQ